MPWRGRSEQEIRAGGDAGARERQRSLDTEKKGGDTVCGQGDRRAWVPGDGDCRESRDWELQRWRRLKPGGLP